MILFGGFDKVGMRQWQERLRAAEHEIEPTPHHGENAASDGSEFHENVEDEGSADLLSPDAGQPK